jgi:MFS family permease
MHIFSKNLWALFGSRIFTHAGLNVIGVFLPTYIYLEYGGSLQIVILTFVAAFTLHLLLIPLTTRFLKNVGMKKLMILALVPFLLVALGALAFWDYAPTTMLITYVVAWGLYRALYWVPYHVEVTTFLDKGHRGRQVSFFTNLVAVSAIIAPLLGGLIIQYLGFQSMFIAGFVLVAASVVPLLFLKETHEEYTFSYTESMQNLFAKKNRNMFLAYAGDGAQTVVALVFWPIFIYLVFKGNFAAVGAASSLVVLVTIVLSAYAGELVDRMSKAQLMVVSTIVYTTGWFLKSFATTALHILLFDAYHSAGKAVNRVTFDAGSYANLADNGHYVDEYTAFKEMALNVGRIVMLLFGGLLALFFGLNVAFILAAFASLTMVLVNSAHKKKHAPAN